MLHEEFLSVNVVWRFISLWTVYWRVSLEQRRMLDAVFQLPYISTYGRS